MTNAVPGAKGTVVHRCWLLPQQPKQAHRWTTALSCYVEQHLAATWQDLGDALCVCGGCTFLRGSDCRVLHSTARTHTRVCIRGRHCTWLRVRAGGRVCVCVCVCVRACIVLCACVRVCRRWLIDGHAAQGKLQSALHAPSGVAAFMSAHSKLHILPLVWIFPLVKG